jgi:hypothetical protein
MMFLESVAADLLKDRVFFGVSLFYVNTLL